VCTARAELDANIYIGRQSDRKEKKRQCLEYSQMRTAQQQQGSTAGAEVDI